MMMSTFIQFQLHATSRIMIHVVCLNDMMMNSYSYEMIYSK